MTEPKGYPTCGAPKRQGEGSCARPKGWGTDHPGSGRCKLHGGSSPSGKKAAKVEEAVTAVATYGLAREVDPHEALLEELHRTAGHVAWLAREVQELETKDLHGPVGSEGMNEQGVEHHPRSEPNIWLTLYKDERQHLVRVAKTCVDVGIEERRVAIAEQQGALLAQVIRGVLSGMGLDPASPKAREVVRRELMAVSTTARELEPAGR